MSTVCPLWLISHGQRVLLLRAGLEQVLGGHPYPAFPTHGFNRQVIAKWDKVTRKG